MYVGNVLYKSELLEIKRKKMQKKIGFMMFLASSSASAPGKFIDTHYECVDLELVNLDSCIS